MLQEIETTMSSDQLAQKLTQSLGIDNPDLLKGFTSYLTPQFESRLNPPEYEQLAKLTNQRSGQLQDLLAENSGFDDQTIISKIQVITSEAFDPSKDAHTISIEKVALLFATFQHLFNSKNNGEQTVLLRFAATINSPQFSRDNKKIAPLFIRDLQSLFTSLYKSFDVGYGTGLRPANQNQEKGLAMLKLLDTQKNITEYSLPKKVSSPATLSMAEQAPL